MIRDYSHIAIKLTNVSKRYTRYPGGYWLVSHIRHENLPPDRHHRPNGFWENNTPQSTI